MSKEAVIQLFRATQADADLKQKLNTSPDLESLVEMAKSYGYEFTVEEWKEATGFSVEELQGKLSEIPGI
ncbi:Nif11-like leader peptide family natural product precursor [cf. Phormidesmis sp. LEGE 11477]|uniref:Nif11-like leader peptide family natural product precursor n=1 Tax=cf. Phormidesmis sp. LEGE 11477 TaxID=1828680 RepID=UPI001881B93C|nr:Nif11-like leader peptide family natural product precursor [cf. Phormidesmis sp. LEGE 11477]MBE9062986.1 Nif11-like leader peptide family natural product precursor [cf. Phormidesmis sp. LEGE 11477]